MQQGAYMRTQRRRKRGKRILATVAFVLVVSSVATVICLAMFFGIEDISVTGSIKYTPEELISLANITMGENIFAIDTVAAEQNIYKNCPYIETVKVRRLLPTAVQLVVTETAPVYAIVDSATHYTLLGSNSRVLEHVDDVSTEGVPIIVGADFSKLPVGSVVNQRELDSQTKRVAAMSRELRDELVTKEQYEEAQRYLELLYRSVDKLGTAQRLVGATTEEGIADVSYYDVSDDLSVSILFDNRVLIEFGSELELDYKLQFAKQVLDELEDTFTGTVNLSTAGNNRKAYTRERDIAPLMNRIYHDGYY